MEEKNYAEKQKQSEIVCKNCAAKLSFKPGTTNLKCEYCGAENEIKVEVRSIDEIPYYEFIKNAGGNVAAQVQVTTVKCDACAAETTFKPNVTSDQCAFCGNNIVIKGGTTHSAIRPGSVLPFQIEQKVAMDKFRTWLDGLWFAPNDLKKYAREGKISGMYIPYWTYDSATITEYKGERGDDYQETEQYTDDKGERQTRTVTKTRWSSAWGTVYDDFDDVMVVASKSLPKAIVDELEPWDTSKLINFDEKFLSGFQTESYQVDVKEGFEEAKDKMEVVIRETVKRDIGGDHQRISSLNTQYNDVTFKHTLLPIWISAYQYNQKPFRFLVNGQTGEVRGERPYSAIKIILFVLMIIAIIVAIWFIFKEKKESSDIIFDNYDLIKTTLRC